MSRSSFHVVTQVHPLLWSKYAFSSIMAAYQIGVRGNIWHDYNIDATANYTCLTTFTADGEPDVFVTKWKNPQGNKGKIFSIHSDRRNIDKRTDEFKEVRAWFENLAYQAPPRKPVLSLV